MQTKVEGIILSKIPFKEKDLICRLLLRNVKKVSVLFYGGQGSGRRQTSSHLELGNLIRAYLQRKRATEGEQLYVAHECTSLWRSKLMRTHHQAFFLSCLFLETLEKISLPELLQNNQPDHEVDHRKSDEESEFVGSFRVASNGLFYLEDALKKNNFHPFTHFFLFFSKLLFELGMMPNLNHCVLCNEALRPPLHFLHHLGGFACLNCSSISTSASKVAQQVLENLLHVRQLKYQDFEQLPNLSLHVAEELFLYFCYQCHLDKVKFKSVKFLLPVHS